jgi:molecular chaperone GrpE
MDSSNLNGKTTAVAEHPEIESLQAQIRSEHDMYLRSLADFDNYRKRTEKDIAGAVERGKRTLILSFLEVLDSFDRALQQAAHAPTAALVEGLEAVHRKTIGMLQAEGVTAYKSVGEPFDPALHEAVASTLTNEHPPGTVVDELQAGYRAGDLVLRPARVRVSQQP